jgi:peptidoglycan/xylan/chitin deacetylase (PgdA/CDA1 family)
MHLHRRIRAAAAPIVKSLFLRGGIYSGLRKASPSRKLAILRYHAICDPDAGYAEPGICVSPAAFERHIAYLAANYRVLSLPDATASLKRGAKLPANAVSITFDDGYADNLDAARILERHGLCATFYITAGCLADGAPFWPAELRVLVKAIVDPVIELYVNGTRVNLPVTTAAERRKAVSRLTRIFKSIPIPVRESLRERLRRQAGVRAVPSPMLSWDDLMTMRRLGMVIGSHTMTHPNLPNAGLADARREIATSKATLEARLCTPVTMFSYPNGGAECYVTPDIARLVREAGFEAATTSRNAFAGPESDLYALERVQVAERLEDLVFALEVERFAFKPAPRPAGRGTDAGYGG